jgi:hypothetical protein
VRRVLPVYEVAKRHKNVILTVVNAGKMRTKGEQRRRKGFIGFSRNLLISFDYGQLRQVLMKLVVRLLTEMLEVRILPGEPNLFDLKKLQSVGRAFGSRPNAWACEVKSPLRKPLNEKHFSLNYPGIKRAVMET